LEDSTFKVDYADLY